MSSNLDPETFLEKINEYNDKFFSSLDDLSNSYINYKMYPEYNEYQQIYATSKGNVESIQADIFVATNNIQNNIDSLNKLITDLNKKISTEKNKNNTLKSELANISSNSNGSVLLTIESNSLYMNQYILNATMGTGIIIVLFALFKVYSKKTIMPIN
jgi:predicted RNase H-like nuclease (RuvC/YqgF family)